MAARTAVLIAFAMVTGCKYGPDAFSCTDDTSCGAGGRCESDHFCSFPDSTCVSGRKYGELGGPDSGKCVGAEQVPDAGFPISDAASDARAPDASGVCFGSPPFTICLAAAPTAAVNLTAATIDTTSSTMCVATVSGATNYCVIAGTTIAADNKLRATGTNPLVLLATDSIFANANGATTAIDVGSHRGENPETGAGADPTDCAAMAGTAPTTGGGGAGGSFTGLGGAGAASASGGSTGGTPGAAITAIAKLRGGCRGQDGQGTGKGTGGHGGGALLLIAGNAIHINGGILAGGEGGHGAQKSNPSSGGGGGGAGGMIVFDAPTISSNGLLIANGGGGGEGADEVSGGADDGADAVTQTAAAGGPNGNLTGGAGGNGSAGAAAGPGARGSAGIIIGPGHGGGGGGGGGAGLIKAPAGANLDTQVSPAATP